jgi:hypothetical protein
MTQLPAVAPADLDQARANRAQAQANLETAKAALQAAKADLAKAQAELPYLLGKGAKEDKQAEATRRALDWLMKQQVAEAETMNERLLYARAIAQAQAAWEGGRPQGTVADKLRKALDKTVSLDYVDDSRLGSILDHLQEAAGVPIVTTVPRDTKMLGIKVQNVPLGAAFQCVEDVGKVQFGVRDYGILVSDKLSTGVTRLHDFWKAGDKPKAGNEKPRSSGRNPPSRKVEGKVTKIDADSGLVEISVTTGDGLAEGHTLEVYRTGSGKGAKYLGTLRVEKLGAGASVGKFINKLNAPVQVGDLVSSEFFVD